MTTRRRVPRAPRSGPEVPPDLLVLPAFSYFEKDPGRGARRDAIQMRIALFSTDPRDIPMILKAFTV